MRQNPDGSFALSAVTVTAQDLPEHARGGNATTADLSIAIRTAKAREAKERAAREAKEKAAREAEKAAKEKARKESEFSKDQEESEFSFAELIDNVWKTAATNLIGRNIIARTVEGIARFHPKYKDLDFRDMVRDKLDSWTNQNPDATSTEKEAAEKEAMVSAWGDIAKGVKGEGKYNDVRDMQDKFNEAMTVEQDKLDAVPEKGSWDYYVHEFFNSEDGARSAREILQGQADYMKGQADEWKTSQDESLKSWTYNTAAAKNKQNGILDDLIDQSKTSTGLFSPVSFRLNGQDVSFAPRANREQAAQQAGFGQTQFDNTTGYFDKLLANQNKLADDKLQNAGMSSPEAGPLAYLMSLKNMGEQSASIEHGIDLITSQNQNAAADRDAMKPGALDYIQALGSFF
jgi:soluble cytochrome b562